jgi:hypothetical protein
MGIGKVDGGWKNRPSEKTQRKISGPGIPALEGLKCLNQVSNILQPQLHDMMRTTVTTGASSGLILLPGFATTKGV